MAEGAEAVEHALAGVVGHITKFGRQMGRGRLDFQTHAQIVTAPESTAR